MEDNKQNTDEQDSKGVKSIIDVIIKDSQAVLVQTMEIHPDIKARGIVPKTITTENFFAESEDQRFVTRAAFLAHVRSLTRNQLIAFGMFLKYLCEGRKIDCPFQKLDANEKPYMWVGDKQQLGDRGFKVLTVGRIWELVELYQFGIFKCDFSLESLYKEALKSETTDPTSTE